MWTRVWASLRNLLFRRRIDSEVDEELAFHLEHAIAAHVSRGLSPEEARRAALQDLSGLTQTREAIRDERSIWFDAVWLDVKYGLRSLRREPGFAAIAALTLGVAVGANNTIFTVVNAACLRGIGIVDPARVLFLGSLDERGTESGVSYSVFEEARSATQTFQGLAAHAAAPVALGDEGRAPDRVFGNYVTGNTLQILGESPVLGRDFQPQDDRPGAPMVVILGGDVWRSRYGGDSSLVGRTVRVDGVSATVVGVTRAGFKLPNNADLWLPLAQDHSRAARRLTVFGRLSAGATLAGAREEMDAVFSRLAQQYPETNRGVHPVVVPLNDRYNSDISSFLPFIAVGLMIVLIACGNVSNLLLMRSITRAREIAMRASLGATRWRIVRQLLTESALLAAAGGAVGWGLSVAATHFLWIAIPINARPYWFDYSMDVRVLAALTGVCVTTVFLFGLVPALHVAKTDTMEVLKSGGRSSAGGLRTRKWTTVFLAAQFGFSTIFVATLVNSERVTRMTRGTQFSIDLSGLQTTWVSLPLRKYGNPESRMAFHQRLRERIDASPGVRSSTVATALPSSNADARQMTIDGRRDTPGAALPTVWTITVGPRYFETLGLPIRGRDVRAERPQGSSAIDVVVNQRLADVYFPGEDPIGHQLTVSGTNTRTVVARIVGVSATLQQRSASGAEPDPLIYLPFSDTAPATVALIVRGGSDDDAQLAQVREAVRSLDPDLPIYRSMRLSQAIEDLRWANRQSEAISYTLIAIALTMAIVGLYAVTAHAVRQRTQEIGVRIALGARRGGIVSLVLGRMLRQLSIGLVAGIVCTFAWERLFNSVSAEQGVAAAFRMTDVSVLFVTEAVIVVAAVAACLSIAFGATRLDPIVALRHE